MTREFTMNDYFVFLAVATTILVIGLAANIFFK